VAALLRTDVASVAEQHEVVERVGAAVAKRNAVMYVERLLGGRVESSTHLTSPEPT
jgi:hypothetical protein